MGGRESENSAAGAELVNARLCTLNGLRLKAARMVVLFAGLQLNQHSSAGFAFDDFCAAFDVAQRDLRQAHVTAAALVA